MVDSALKRLADVRKPGQWVIAALEGVQASEGTGRFDPGWFHPSDFGSDCDAFLAFRFLGAPSVSSISARTQRIFDLGNARDVSLREDMARAGVSLLKKPEDRNIVIEHLRIRGELDDWVQHPISKERFIVDYKTMRPDAWVELKEVKRDHFLQVHPYMYAKQTYKGLVLYENKGTQELKIMEANFDGQVWQKEIVERTERIISGLEKDHVNRNPVSCSGCPFFANGVCTTNNIRELKVASGLWS